MKIKTINTKVGEKENNLKLKAQSLKREFISRFQLLIIYINFMQKTNKKVGKLFSEIRSQKVGRGLRILKKVGVMGIMFAAVFLAVLRQAQNKLWAVLPATRERRESGAVAV